MTKPFSMFEPAKGDSRWLLVGEAPGAEEEKVGRPFVGPSGKLLDGLLETAGFSRSQFHITNVFSERPPDNMLKENWTLTKTDLKRLGFPTIGRLPPLNKRYIHPDHEWELDRLAAEVNELQPDFILMLGGTALWAFTGEGKIGVNRGTLLPLSSPIRCSQEEVGLLSFKPSPVEASPASNALSLPAPVLPQWAGKISPRWGLASYHPAAVIRQWDQRPYLWADLVKARRFLQGSLPSPLRRKLWVDPSLEDLEQVYHSFKTSGECLGTDIETDPRIGQITMISFATPDEAICIPFFNKNTLAHLANYWKTPAEEAQAWRWVMRFAALPNKKVGQNFIYDHQYLLEDLDIRVRNCDDDTAILQHCLQPELQKALGTLASLYLNEPSWKFMRTSEKDVNKADD